MTRGLKITACSLLAALLTCACAICACSSDEIYVDGVRYEYFATSNPGLAINAMGSEAQLSVYLPSSEESDAEEIFENLYADVCDAVYGLDEELSSSAPAQGEEESSVFRFNEAGPGQKVEIGKGCYDVLKLSLEMHEKTNGYFNPAVYWSVTAYGFGENGKYPASAADLPSDDELAAYVELSEYFSEIELSYEDGKYSAKKPDRSVIAGGETISMKIDLGGVGKGYATDIVSDIMDDRGCEYGYFNFANSSLSIKKYPDEDRDCCYGIGIQNPRGDGACASGYFKNVNLSTSGDYEQCYTIDDNKTYCHIINPKTGSPIETGIMSATVMGGSAAEDDAYSTALMAMEIDYAAAFVKENLSDKMVILIYEQDGEYRIEANFDGIEIAKESGFVSYDILK